jgi:hypothetical protein
MGNRELIAIMAAVIYAVKTRDQRLRDIGTDVSMSSTSRKEIADAVQIAKAALEESTRA